MTKVFVAFAATLTLLSCQEGSKKIAVARQSDAQALTIDQDTFEDFPVIAFSSLANFSEAPQLSRPELRAVFCIDAYKLTMHADFSDLLAILCTDGKAHANFANFDSYAGSPGTTPRAMEIALEDSNDGYSTATYVVAYRVPVATKWLRTASIPTYMVSKINLNNATSSGKVTADLTKTLGGTLQYGKWHTASQMQIKTPSGEVYDYDRTTELNSYQVQGGNSDLGLALEHLTSTNDNNFRQYRVLTVSLANFDKTTTVITFMNISMANRGYAALTHQIMNNMANAQNIKIYNAILAEHKSGLFDGKGSP